MTALDLFDIAGKRAVVTGGGSGIGTMIASGLVDAGASVIIASRKADWAKLVKTWDRVVAYINDPKTQDDAVKIMAARVGLTPAAYKPLLAGTKLLTLEEGRKIFKKADGLGSLYGSSKIADNFNVKFEVYKTAQNIDSYIDPSLTEAAK